MPYAHHIKMQIWKSLLNLFLQSNCPLCQRAASQEFCEYCHKQLQKCRLTGSNSSKNNLLSPPVIAWGAYGGAIKRAIATMKYENHPEIARPLGEWLGETWLQEYGVEGFFYGSSNSDAPGETKRKRFQSSRADCKKLLSNNWAKIKGKRITKSKEN